MDKMRAIQFFNHSVESGSFAATARALEVTTPAVSQLVSALEHALGTALFHRTSRGVTLTTDGERYYETCSKLAAELHDTEQRLGPRGAKPRGTLTVGMRHGIGQNCVMPRIARFLTRYPDVELITKPVALGDFERGTLDLAVMVGWPPKRDLIARTLAQTRHVVCASPAYWKRMGHPTEPDALRNHHCLVFRNDEGVLVDRWAFEKAGEQRVVNVKSRLLSDDRTWLDSAAVSGAGVIRLTDLTAGSYLSSGLLVPALTDWESVEAPTIYALYRKSHRQSKMVKAFLDFLMEVFTELEQERTPVPTNPVLRVRQPVWFGRTHVRQSTFAPRRR